MKINVMAGVFCAGVTAFLVSSSTAQELFAPPEPDPGQVGSELWEGYTPYKGEVKSDGKTACCAPCPTVYGYAESLFLQRTNCSDEQPILVNLRRPDGSVAPPNEGTPVLSTRDLDFGFDPAVRVLLGHRLHDGWALEGGYLGFWDADTSAYTEAPNDAAIYTFPGGLGTVNVPSDFDRVWTSYSSAVHSGELNLVHCNGCCEPCGKGLGEWDSKDKGSNVVSPCQTFEWLVGVRYLNLTEDLKIYGEREQTTGGGDTGIESSIYDIGTSNNLYGAQAGARFRRWGQKLGWEATGKAGLFASDTQQEQYVTDYPDGFLVRPLTSASDDGVAFVGELNLTGIYRLNDVWNLRAGYNLMWITGVALAPDQLDFSGELPAGNQISSNGGLFLHGVSCGLEARW